MQNIIFYYCFIKPEYLRSIFSQDDLSARKYLTRPFLYFPNLKMAIAIPRLTIHKNKTKYNLNFYFNDDQHYLDIPNCLFVPENMVYTNERWLKNNIQEDYKVEIQNNIDDIIDKILKVSAKIATNQNFKNKHKFYLISKQQYEEWKK